MVFKLTPFLKKKIEQLQWLSNHLAGRSEKIAIDVVTTKTKETIALQGTNIRQKI